MNLIQLKEKVNKGIELGAQVVYIKEESLLFGIEKILKNEENKSIVLVKSKGESLKSEDFINIIDEIYNHIGDVEVFIGKDNKYRNEDKSIEFVEFAQYEDIKMLFLNSN
ncbi:hypothetical protein JGS6364_24821 [[Clostridium] sordellii]|uniref:Uncharacterized protein n=1 Tax=Paraclostridium sordellii TaxID=1505 RepID=A0A9P1P9W1_PARSO|nr:MULTISPECIES: hypothetical protein [Paeniclostridium]EPZ56565.1 hypothetical protein H477_2811 [[Clostridium] sordellii ATCC 9714] [Paeniclostridium sordellii ATCC 9714]MDU5020322.1 hypothetical protein [Clostridiales bacterium]AUN15141.1 hypothetical protein RSJ16_13280 [Paeniclostridium sordellii]EPZ59791.1 hypothetical protein H476_0932 [[Clostridium] sordellii VPI 9048] [Paeniclostridium sordellii VPI 9048]MBS6023899.1 hypothetical protein [Paeniclostridium sordellii]